MSKNINKQIRLSRIEVRSLRLRAYIGFENWEREKLQDLVLSYSFTYDVGAAVEKDDVQFAVNYKALTKQIIQLVDNQSFDLIEALADLIYETIESFNPKIQHIAVTVEKPHALRFADNVMVHIDSRERYKTALIAMGSNIDAETHMQMALIQLQALGIITQRSEFITTKPLKFEDQPDFLNGAIELKTKLSFLELEFKLKEIEAIMGRVRSDNKNAPRVIDLDVLAFNGRIEDREDFLDLPFLKEFVEKLSPGLLNT